MLLTLVLEAAMARTLRKGTAQPALTGSSLTQPSLTQPSITPKHADQAPGPSGILTNAGELFCS